MSCAFCGGEERSFLLSHLLRQTGCRDLFVKGFPDQPGLSFQQIPDLLRRGILCVEPEQLFHVPVIVRVGLSLHEIFPVDLEEPHGGIDFRVMGPVGNVLVRAEGVGEGADQVVQLQILPLPAGGNGSGSRSRGSRLSNRVLYRACSYNRDIYREKMLSFCLACCCHSAYRALSFVHTDGRQRNQALRSGYLSSYMRAFVLCSDFVH